MGLKESHGMRWLKSRLVVFKLSVCPAWAPEGNVEIASFLTLPTSLQQRKVFSLQFLRVGRWGVPEPHWKMDNHPDFLGKSSHNICLSKSSNSEGVGQISLG